MLGLPVGTTEREEEDVVDELDLTRLAEGTHPRTHVMFLGYQGQNKQIALLFWAWAYLKV